MYHTNHAKLWHDFPPKLFMDFEVNNYMMALEDAKEMPSSQVSVLVFANKERET